MHSVTVSTFLPVAPTEVWSKIGDPANISAWHPVIATSSVDGVHRICVLANGAAISEQIDAVDDANHSYSYRILESPLPLTDYRSTIQVVAAGDGCTVEWTASFEIPEAPPAEVIGMMNEVFGAGMSALREAYAG